MMQRSVIRCVFCTVLGASVSAVAVPIDVAVAIKGKRVYQRSALTVTALVRMALRSDPRFHVLTAENDADSGEQIKRARQLIKTGREAYEELEVETAQSDLEEAAEILLDHLDLLSNPAEVADVLVLLGAIQQANGDAEQANEWFSYALSVVPNFSPQSSGLGPQDVAHLSELQDDLAFSEPGHLTVRAGGVATELWLDGRFVGVTPVKLSSVGPGKHVYAARRSGYHRKTGHIQIESGKHVRLSPILDRLPHGEKEGKAIARLRLRKERYSPTMAKVANAFGAPDEIIVGSVAAGKGGDRLRLYRVSMAEKKVLSTVNLAVPTSVTDLRQALEGPLHRLLEGESPVAAPQKPPDAALVTQPPDSVATQEVAAEKTERSPSTPVPRPATPSLHPARPDPEEAAEAPPGSSSFLLIAGSTLGGLSVVGLLAGGAAAAVWLLNGSGQGTASSPAAANGTLTAASPGGTARRHVVLGF